MRKLKALNVVLLAALLWPLSNVAQSPNSLQPGGTLLLLVEDTAKCSICLGQGSASWASSTLERLPASVWIGLMTFNTALKLQVDFTQDHAKIVDAILHLQGSAIAEANTLDALSEAALRLSRVPGKKTVLVVGTDANDLSTHTYADTLATIQRSDIGYSFITEGASSSQKQRQLEIASVTGGWTSFVSKQSTCDPNWSPILDGLSPDPQAFKAAIPQRLAGLIAEFGGLEGAIVQNQREIQGSQDQIPVHESAGDEAGVSELRALIRLNEGIIDILKCRQSISSAQTRTSAPTSAQPSSGEAVGASPGSMFGDDYANSQPGPTTSARQEDRSNFVTPVPQCVRQEVTSNTWYLVNVCDARITVNYTSSGNIWGRTPLGPGENYRSGHSGEEVTKVGGVSVYACPGDATPVEPNGHEMPNNYKGEYACFR